MADVPDKVLQEKLRAKEEELKKREREVRQRETILRERTEDLDASKASCDALMVELHAREATIADTEKKHGTLKRRTDEVSSRELVLSDREAALQGRLQAIALEEQSVAKAKSAATQQLKDEEARLQALQAKIDAKSHEVQNGDAALAAQRAAHQKRVAEDDDLLRRREKAAADIERRAATATRAIELKTLETEHLHEQAAERLKVVKAELVELETKLREVRWKDDTLKEMLDAATAQKQHLTQWEAALTAREAKMLVRETTLSEVTLRIDVREAEANAKLERLIAAETDLAAREAKLGEERQRLAADVEAHCANEANLTVQRSQLEQLQAALSQRERDLISNMDHVETKRRSVRHLQHTVTEKERALKTWLLELEYRQQAIEHRESHPRPYLEGPSMEGNPVLQAAAGARDPSSSSLTGSRFNSALVELQVAHLQRAYLGATSAKAARSGADSDPARRAEQPSPSSANFNAVVMGASADAEIAAQADDVGKMFRDLTAGFATMDAQERDERFTTDEVVTISQLIEAESESFDEHLFLESLRASAMPAVAINLAPRDSKLVAAVQSWAAGRQALVDERYRRSREKRVALMQKAVDLLEGRVTPHAQRVLSMTAGGRPASRQSRTPTVVVDSHGAAAGPRPSSRASRPVSRQSALTDDNDVSWGVTGMSSSSAGRPAPSVARNRRLVDALPPSLRRHYNDDEGVV